MSGNHSRAWHNANDNVHTAQRSVDRAQSNFVSAVRYHGSDAKTKYKVDDAKRDLDNAKASLRAAESTFNSIDRNPSLAYDN